MSPSCVNTKKTRFNRFISLCLNLTSSPPHPISFICLIINYRLLTLYCIPHMSCLYDLSVKERFVLYCIVVTNKTLLKFHTFEIKTELLCCITHYLALTPMWCKSSTLTPLRSRSLFISCMTKTEVHCVHG